MPDRTSHPAGAFSYVELATSDLDAAKAFYSSVFGWEFHDSPLPMGGVYGMAKRRGRTAAAAFVAPEDQGPPHWNNYVTVANVDEIAERAGGLGGTVVAPPFDVMDSGRMTVVQDPTGAWINFWQANRDIGAEVVNEHGSLTWNELATTDPEAAMTFYRDLLGWEYEAIDGAPMPMWIIRLGGRSNGDVRPLGPQEGAAPSYWLPYFAVDDLDGAVQRIRDGGGTVLLEPVEIPAGAFAVARDPQGAVFALFAGEFDD